MGSMSPRPMLFLSDGKTMATHVEIDGAGSPGAPRSPFAPGAPGAPRSPGGPGAPVAPAPRGSRGRRRRRLCWCPRRYLRRRSRSDPSSASPQATRPLPGRHGSHRWSPGRRRWHLPGAASARHPNSGPSSCTRAGHDMSRPSKRWPSPPGRGRGLCGSRAISSYGLRDPGHREFKPWPWFPHGLRTAAR